MGQHVFKPRPGGGRIASGETRFGTYRAEWDAEGNLISHSIEMMEHRTPNPTDTERVTWREAAARIAHGAAGLAKATLGIDAAPGEVQARRLHICNACPELTDKRRCGKLLSKDKTCGCWVDQKTKVAGEKCPLGKW